MRLWTAPLLLLLMLGRPGGTEELDWDATWREIRDKGKSLVFGRLEGRFDGSDYRGRKIRVRNRETNHDHFIAVEQGLGGFEAVLPTGTYALVSIEATYFPRVKPLDPSTFPPVPQRYSIRPNETGELPSFPVGEVPVYLGTLRSSLGVDGTIYRGHELELVDDYETAWRRLREAHPGLAESLDRSSVSPRRAFILEPSPATTEATAEAGGALELELDSGEDALGRARLYIRQGKFREAVAWLSSSLPMSDAQRTEIRLLTGEALLGDRRYPEAVEELGETLLVAPENARALRLLARAHAFNGDGDDAVNLYHALSDMLPDDAEASLYLGYYHALRSEAKPAKAYFAKAFEANFDYLLHDSTPYALALRAENARYEPPAVVDAPPFVQTNLRSRRNSRGAFAILLDPTGKVVAAHMTPEAESWATTAVMSFVRARFHPATLNGVPIPCLVIVGAEDGREREGRR